MCLCMYACVQDLNYVYVCTDSLCVNCFVCMYHSIYMYIRFEKLECTVCVYVYFFPSPTSGIRILIFLVYWCSVHGFDCCMKVRLVKNV